MPADRPCRTPAAPPHPGHAALRRGRASLPGQVYLVTFATEGRHPLFADPSLATAAARALADPRLWPASRLLCWVLMPDHWHGLLELGRLDSLEVRIGLLKSNTARVVRRQRPEVARVWARGYHDHALRAEESMQAVARYIVLNPVRAGLVRRVGEWPYWDAVWL
jgi:putative transposase